MTNMKQLDKAVVHESLYVAAWVLILSAIMQAVFLLIGKWDLRVLYGNLLSGALSILNFFFMAFCSDKNEVVFPEISYGVYEVFFELY